MIPNLSKISSFACGPLFHFSHIYHISQENWILWKNESLSSTFSKDFPTMTYRATDFEKEKYRVLENESKKDIFLLCYVKANFVNHLVFLLAIKRIATNCIPSRKCFIYPFAWKKLFLTWKIRIFRIHSDSKITSIILCLDDIINNGNALHTFCSDSSLFLLTMLHNERSFCPEELGVPALLRCWRQKKRTRRRWSVLQLQPCQEHQAFSLGKFWKTLERSQVVLEIFWSLPKSTSQSVNRIL